MALISFAQHQNTAPASAHLPQPLAATAPPTATPVPLPAGSPCKGDGDCASGYCQGGQCAAQTQPDSAGAYYTTDTPPDLTGPTAPPPGLPGSPGYPPSTGGQPSYPADELAARRALVAEQQRRDKLVKWGLVLAVVAAAAWLLARRRA